MIRRHSDRARRRPFARPLDVFESLERRMFLSITVAAGNHTLGTLEDYVPAGGIVKTKPVAAGKSGSAGGDGAPGYQITLQFTGSLTPSQQAVFTQSAALWQSILTGDLPDVNSPTYGLIDDVLIQASGEAIDGVGMILGSAGPTNIRSDTGLTYRGQMRFDTADLANLENNGLLDEVITHEMGHVLGIGSLWPTFGLVTNRVSQGGTDPRYIGLDALAEYQALDANPAATTIPVENVGGSGTADAHWRENGVGSFGNELMTGYINSSQSNPLSRISAASMIDLGYPLVNVDAAQLYTIPTNPSSDFTPVNPLPVIGTLTSPSANVSVGSPFMLSVNAVSDSVGGVASTSFYRESNGIPGLQSTGTVASDTLIGTSASLTPSVSVSPNTLNAGSYTFYARTVDTFGALSAVASTTVAVVTAPATPSQPTLAAASDTGDSSSDGITMLNVLTFTGTAMPNSTVTLFRGGTTAIGSGVADNAGNYTVTTSSLADGTFAVTAIASVGSASSMASTARTITVDTAAPAVLTKTYDREVTQAITLTLSDALASRLTTSSFTLENLTLSTTIANTSVAVSGGGTTVTLDRAALLPNGNYRLTLPAANLTDVAGNPLTAPVVLTFRQLAGDANDNGTVDFQDLVVLSQNYGTTGRTFSGGNFNYSSDGLVDFADLVILAQNYNASLSTAAGIVGPATETTKKVVRTKRAGVDVLV